MLTKNGATNAPLPSTRLVLPLKDLRLGKSHFYLHLVALGFVLLGKKDPTSNRQKDEIVVGLEHYFLHSIISAKIQLMNSVVST